MTGIGIGADLAIINTYINEVAHRRSRAKFTTVIFIMSALGAFFGIWLGLWLCTSATPWPLGLPFALAGPLSSNCSLAKNRLREPDSSSKSNSMSRNLHVSKP